MEILSNIPTVYEITTPTYTYLTEYLKDNKGWILYRGTGITQKVLTFDGWNERKTNYSIAQIFPRIEDVKEYIERL